MATPSEEIADQLREQIHAGRLQPGDRLPSARAITRKWGVALATASRVHTLLRADGLATSVPGAGTFVATRPASSDAPRRTRSRRASPSTGIDDRTRRARRGAAVDTGVLMSERIVGAAVAIADAEGVNALSMRRIALEVGAAPMSLYRHVADKEDLQQRMMSTVLREWDPGNPPATWQSKVRASERAMWRLFRRHQWLAATLSVTRPQMLTSGLAYTEWVLQALMDEGLSPVHAFDIHLALFTYVRGIAVLLEPEAEAQATTGLDADTWVDGQRDWLLEQAADGSHTAFSRVVEVGYDLDLDRLFEQGLTMLINGLESRLSAARPPQW